MYGRQAQGMKHIEHVPHPILRLKKHDNAYLTHVHHLVWCVAQENEIQETYFPHNKYSRIYTRHIYYVSHDTIYLYTFVYLTFLCFPWSKIRRLSDAFDKCFWIFSAKLTSVFFCCCVSWHLCIQKFTIMDLNSDNQVEDEPFVCSIQAIYNLSAAYWCTDPTVNIYIKVLR